MMEFTNQNNHDCPINLTPINQFFHEPNTTTSHYRINSNKHKTHDYHPKCVS